MADSDGNCTPKTKKKLNLKSDRILIKKQDTQHLCHSSIRGLAVSLYTYLVEIQLDLEIKGKQNVSICPRDEIQGPQIY